MDTAADDEAPQKCCDRDECKRVILRNMLLKLKIILFIICIVGFSYQVHQFMNLYHKYPTVQDVLVEVNKEYIVPAITYCYFKSATRNNFCEKYNTSCIVPSRRQCRMYPDYCKNKYMIPIGDELASLQGGSLEDFTEPNVGNITDFMTSNPWSISKRDVIGPYVSLSWYSFNVSVCFALNTRVNSTEEPRTSQNNNSKRELYDHEKYFTGTIQFNLKEMIDKDPNVTHSIAISAHSPFIVSQPEKETAMTPKNRYEILIGMEDVNRAPYPYSRECIDYIAQWERNGNRGPRSQKACRDICEVEYDTACFGCVNAWNLFPIKREKCITGFNMNPDSICSKNHTVKYRKCLSDCKLECSKTTYTYTIKQIEKDPWDSRGYEEGVIDVDVFMKTQTVVYTDRPQYDKIYTDRPQYDTVELFSNIGGYMGIWLGLSLFALVDMLRSVFKILKPFLRKAGAKIKDNRLNKSDESSDAKF